MATAHIRMNIGHSLLKESIADNYKMAVQDFMNQALVEGKQHAAPPCRDQGQGLVNQQRGPFKGESPQSLRQSWTTAKY